MAREGGQEWFQSIGHFFRQSGRFLKFFIEKQLRTTYLNIGLSLVGIAIPYLTLHPCQQFLYFLLEKWYMIGSLKKEFTKHCIEV